MFCDPTKFVFLSPVINPYIYNHGKLKKYFCFGVSISYNVHLTFVSTTTELAPDFIS